MSLDSIDTRAVTAVLAFLLAGCGSGAPTDAEATAYKADFVMGCAKACSTAAAADTCDAMCGCAWDEMRQDRTEVDFVTWAIEVRDDSERASQWRDSLSMASQACRVQTGMAPPTPGG